MNISTEMITPSAAAKLLEGNLNNRAIKRGLVNALAASMTNGSWKLNGETIKIGANGRLIDGQHRLIACVQSGVSFRTVIARDMPEDIFDTVDTGITRSAADVLTCAGQPNANVLAAAMGIVWRWQNGILGSTSTERMPKEEFITMLEMHPDLQASTAPARRISVYTGFVGPMTAFHYLFTKANPAKATEFFEGLETGAGLQTGSPILALRNYMANVRTSNYAGSARPKKVYAPIIKAWNAFCAGRQLSVIRFSVAETFPEIRGFAPVLFADAA